MLWDVSIPGSNWLLPMSERCICGLSGVPGLLLKIARAKNCSFGFLTKDQNCFNLFQLEADKTEQKTKTHRRLSRSLNFRNSCDFWNIWTKIDRCLEIQMLSFSPPTHISQKNIQINEFLWPLGIPGNCHGRPPKLIQVPSWLRATKSSRVDCHPLKWGWYSWEQLSL